ncbi:zinc finger protein 652-B-like [Cloeon dipterum]|uniref:zinc finger protein 652-B-like n=1 Tax=Cloeon dipterum TaxID=197152 RepID=UPI0032208583
MPLVKPLCRICERPTADGAVQAVQLDKEKLQTWFLNVCGYELAEEIQGDDLICNFCIWHAEFHSKYVSEFEALAWWQPHLVYLDDVAKELRWNHLEGKAEQCWVQLEKIKLPKSEKVENAENEETSDGEKSGRKCFYCGQVVAYIRSHVRNMHENAIRCDYKSCATYFHTVEEKQSHTMQVHEKSKTYKKHSSLKYHLKMKHRNDSWRGLQYKKVGFKCEPCKRFHSKYVSDFEALDWWQPHLVYLDDVEKELRRKYLAHKKEDEEKVFKCQYCEFKTSKYSNLKNHISRFHLPKTVKCDKCDKMFASKQLLAYHVNKQHL